MAERIELPVRPFYCGSQYMDWTVLNCDGCGKQAAADAALDEMPCEIERALADACLDDGTVTPEIARRMGLPEDVRVYCWPCPERDPAWSVGG